VIIRVALSNGVHVLVRGRASDTDADAIEAAVFEGSDHGRDLGVSVDWILTESEVQTPAPAEFLHPASVAQPSESQLEELRRSVQEQRAVLAELRAADPAALSPINRARLPQRLAEAQAAVEGGDRAVRGLAAALRSMRA